MSPARDTPTETDLLAYADARLDDAGRAAVERRLAADPEAAARVAAWRDQNAAIAALHGAADERPVPARLDPRRIAGHMARASRQRARLAAAAAMLLAVGGVAGWLGRDLAAPSPAAMPLIDEAIVAHEVYSGEVVHPVEVAADRRDHMQAWLSKRLDRPLVVPDLRAQSFDLVGGRLLPAAAGPAAQFMYEDKAGHRVTLYVVPDSSGTETAMRWAALDRLGAFTWTDGRIRCAVVGDLPRAELRELARHAYEQLG